MTLRTVSAHSLVGILHSLSQAPHAQITAVMSGCSMTGTFLKTYHADNRQWLMLEARDGDMHLIDVAHIHGITLHNAADLVAYITDRAESPFLDSELSEFKAKRRLEEARAAIADAMGACPPMTIEGAFDRGIWSHALYHVKIFAEEVLKLGQDEYTRPFFVSLTAITLTHAPAARLSGVKEKETFIINDDLARVPAASLRGDIQQMLNRMIT